MRRLATATHLALLSCACAPSTQRAAEVQKAAAGHHMPRVVACWEQAFEENGFVGEYSLTVDFVVDANGQITRATVVEAQDVTAGTPTPLADGHAFSACVATALEHTKLEGLTGPLTVTGYRIAFTDPNRAERQKAADDAPSQLIGPRADRCQGLYGHRPPRDAGQLQKLLGEARAEAAAAEKDADRRARSLQRSYDLAVELHERLERDAGRADLTRAGKKRVRKEMKKVAKVRDAIAAEIGCD